MATTTNYSWTTPDDTDLVKDGAAAIRTLGTAIDTTVFNNAGAAIAKTLIDAKGDLIAGSAADTAARLAVGTNDYRIVAASGEATGLKYVADTQNTVIDAAGDLVYGTAADTLGRLAIGTAGQVLTVNSGATAPEWAAPAGGLSYAIFRDEKSSGTQGGTFTSGAWRTKDLNTSQFNDITGASLASNQITLSAGTYLINAASPAYKTGSHVARLYNITDSAVTLLGASGYVTATGDSSVVYSFINGIFTIAATKTFEVQHQGASTQSSNGFGGATAFQTEVYTSITITKVA